jgi:flagellar hook protein FlgE
LNEELIMGFGTGLSGLNAATKNLDVIGHNIANANTIGMKAGRAEFSEMYAASLGAAGGSSGGIGVSVAKVAQQFSQGNLKVTGNTLDMAVNGEGFFKVALTDGSTAYTRNGEFKLDKEGYIITNGQARLHGFPTDRFGNQTSVETSPLQLPTGATVAPRATGSASTDPGIRLTANLDSRAAVVAAPVAAGATPAPGQTHAVPQDQRKYGTSVNVYDQMGNAIPVQIYFIKSAANTWQVRASTDGGVTTLAQPSGSIPFNAADNLAATPPLYAGQPNYTTLNMANLAITVPLNAVAPGIPSTALTNIPFTFGDQTKGFTLTQYGANFAVTDLKQDGYAAGELTGIGVDEKGVITARYSNGESFASGQVALTRFRNPQGLEPVNGGYWTKSNSSGEPVTGSPLTGRFGQVRSGALEESTVDLTAELVNMIVAQRSYQANAQTIKTQDQVMTTLVNLR